jgi:AAA+ ATPase superfamily predicted ATPase
MDLVGRFEERKIMLDILSTDEAEMLVIIGRRRVGKIFLIREVYKDIFNYSLAKRIGH